MFIGIKMSDNIPTKEDFFRENSDLDRSNKNYLYRGKPYLINPKRFSDEVHSMALTLNCINISLFNR